MIMVLRDTEVSIVQGGTKVFVILQDTGLIMVPGNTDMITVLSDTKGTLY